MQPFDTPATQAAQGERIPSQLSECFKKPFVLSPSKHGRFFVTSTAIFSGSSPDRVGHVNQCLLSPTFAKGGWGDFPSRLGTLCIVVASPEWSAAPCVPVRNARHVVCLETSSRSGLWQLFPWAPGEWRSTITLMATPCKSPLPPFSKGELGTVPSNPATT